MQTIIPLGSANGALRLTTARRNAAEKNAPPKRGISAVWKWECVSRPLDLSSVEEADRQPFVTTGGAGGGYFPIGMFRPLSRLAQNEALSELPLSV
jgi:hypothetical protein